MELRTHWLGKGMSFLANFLEPRLVQSHSTVIIPLYNRVVFVRLLNRSEFSNRSSEVTQTLDAITWSQFRVGSGGWESRAFWPGPSPESLRRVTGAVAELCAVWVLVY